MPLCGQPSSTETIRLVFLTDSTMVSVSSGRIVRRSMTSASIPSSASFSAAFSARSTISENAVMVTSSPSRRTLALPIGSDEVVDLGHVEALAVEHLVLEEHDRVGVADRGLEQALGVGGAVGGDHLEARAVGVPAAYSWLCCAATRAAAPLGPRNTIAQPSSPPAM